MYVHRYALREVGYLKDGGVLTDWSIPFLCVSSVATDLVTAITIPDPFKCSIGMLEDSLFEGVKLSEEGLIV